MKLSVVILNHNTKDLLETCLRYAYGQDSKNSFEVIVSDNDSIDQSVEMVKKKFPKTKILQGENISFSNGNNRVKDKVNGKYILFINTDTFLKDKKTFEKIISFFEKDKKSGALTCKLVLENGRLDKDCRRRFPTPQISFSRLILGNGKKYWYEEIDENQTHEVESIQGAFFLTKKSILDKVGWFDENYKFDGEDIDLCFQIKKMGYKIFYYPKVTALHLKKATRKIVSKKKSVERKTEGVNSMEYFYKKNMWDKYPIVVNYFVIFGINLLKLFRFMKATVK